MKKHYTYLALFVLALSNAVCASSGTITFRGAIVNTPCIIPAATWMHYAQHPVAYQTARLATPAPSCADATATQSVQVSRSTVQARSSSQSGGTIITVVYN